MVGNTAVDRCGQGNNGTLTNGPVRKIGRIGQALEFDGDNDRIDLGTDVIGGDINGASGVTTAMWVKYDRVVGGNLDNLILSINIDGSNTGFSLNLDGTASEAGEINFLARSQTADTATQLASLTNLSSGRWYHVVAVTKYAQDRMEIYIDGVLDF